jgi:hypothetical protein
MEIRCRRCGGRGLFEEPFEFYPERHGKPRVRLPEGGSQEIDLTGRVTHRWGGWIVVERFSSVLSWSTPQPGTGGGAWTGVVRCTGCHAVYVHDLEWPADAYYQWNVRGVTFWAWSTEHTSILLEFLASTDRDASRFGLYRRSLDKLPQAVIAAKNRDLVVRHLRRALEAEGVELPPSAARGLAR